MIEPQSLARAPHKGSKLVFRITAVFFFSALSTEFIYIQFASGVVRPYHFLIPPLLFLMLPNVWRLISSRTAVSLILFLASTFLSVVASSSASTALTSSMLLLLNASMAFLFAAMLINESVSTRFFGKALIRMTFISIYVAFAQFVIMQGAGMPIGYSPQQISQITAGFAPSLFNEANGYAKFLITPFLFLAPFFIRSRSGKSERQLALFITFIFLVNFMRSALMAISLTVIFIMVWYAFVGAFSKFMNRFIPIVIVMVIMIFGTISSGLISSEYTLYKFQSVLDLSSLDEDSSWVFRSISMTLAIEQTISSPWKIMFGNGWGQVYAFFRGETRQLGGADLINVFAYNGVIGVTAYASLLLMALFSAGRRARWALNLDDRLLAEGVLFAIFGNIALGFVSGMLLWPSFWLLIGVAIAMDIEHRREKRLLQLRRNQA